MKCDHRNRWTGIGADWCQDCGTKLHKPTGIHADVAALNLLAQAVAILFAPNPDLERAFILCLKARAKADSLSVIVTARSAEMRVETLLINSFKES